MDVTTNAENREIAHTRVFNAPRELVFDAWTDPAHVSKWWGPVGFTTTTSKHDLRPGGEWLFVMHGPDGHDYPNRVAWREVVRPERLAYRHTGTRDDDPVRFEVEIDFLEHGEQTEVRFRMVIDTREMYEHAVEFGAVEGLRDTLARFAAHLETQS